MMSLLVQQRDAMLIFSDMAQDGLAARRVIPHIVLWATPHQTVSFVSG